jgi:hypothetical protein
LFVSSAMWQARRGLGKRGGDQERILSLPCLGVSYLSQFSLKGKRIRSVCNKEGTLRVLMRVPLQCTRSVRSHAKSLSDTQRSWKVGLGCVWRRWMFVVCCCCVGDVAGCGRGVGTWAISGGGNSNFFEKIDFCESVQKQYDPNENQIYEHKWDYFICRIGELASVGTRSTCSSCM